MHWNVLWQPARITQCYLNKISSRHWFHIHHDNAKLHPPDSISSIFERQVWLLWCLWSAELTWNTPPRTVANTRFVLTWSFVHFRISPAAQRKSVRKPLRVPTESWFGTSRFWQLTCFPQLQVEIIARLRHNACSLLLWEISRIVRQNSWLCGAIMYT